MCPIPDSGIAKTYNQQQAIAMLRERPERDIYEGAGPRGEYWVTYSDGKSPRLTQADVNALLHAGLIEPRYRDAPGVNCYKLRPSPQCDEPAGHPAE